jgi:hypothetical protein
MKQLWVMLNGGPLLPALWVSGQLYLTTLAINIAVGVTLGLLLARSELISAAFEPYIFILARDAHYLWSRLCRCCSALSSGRACWLRANFHLSSPARHNGRRALDPAPAHRRRCHLPGLTRPALARRHHPYVTPTR